jgi:hypothetical protein
MKGDELEIKRGRKAPWSSKWMGSASVSKISGEKPDISGYGAVNRCLNNTK